MELPRNLISDSVLIQETFDLVREKGGRARFTEIADVVFRLSNANEELATLLVADLVRTDPRFSVEQTHLTIVDDRRELRALNEIDFVVFDVEATSGHTVPSRIIELGAYRLHAGQIVDQFQTLINPKMPLTPFISGLTGISDEMLNQAPVFGDVVHQWLDFAGDAVLVAHNANFDLLLLNREISRVFPGCRMRNIELCTVNLSRRLVRQLDSHNLDALAEHFGIEIPDRHRAAGDALATTRALLRLLDQLAEHGVRTLADAHRFCANSEPDHTELFGDSQLVLDT